MGNTVQLHRVLRAPPERVYRAFLDPAALVKWMAPDGYTATIEHLQAEVGGSFRMRFTNFCTQQGHSFGGTYLQLVPGERLQYNDRFDDPNLPGDMLVTVSLRKVLCGTELSITQAGVPESIPVELCYLGWQESLQLLARLVEPELGAAP